MSGFSGAAFGVGQQRVLFTGRGLALNSTADQVLTKNGTFSKFAITGIWVVNASGIPVLAAGGLYTAASKGGTNLVGVGQLYTGLADATTIVPLTLVAGIVTTALTAAALYFALSVANGAAVTVDLYVVGVDLS